MVKIKSFLDLIWLPGAEISGLGLLTLCMS